MENGSKRDKTVFVTSLVVVAMIVLWGLVAKENFKEVGNAAFSFLTMRFGWFYMLCMTAFVVFSLWLCFSRYGNIVLGEDGEKPTYGFVSWFAMLFSAGMGIGLVFYGTAEPLSHFVKPLGAEPGTPEAMAFAIRKSYLHWGLQPWAGYCVIALGLAYMQFRKGKPGLISSLLIPLIGEERARGPFGKAVDILAIFATVAGVATSFGLGTYQINSGLNYLFGVEEGPTAQIAIVGVITAILLMSVTVGLDRGMKFLSNANVVFCGLLMVIMFAVGPKLMILNGFVEGTGDYLNSFIKDSLQLGAYSGEQASWYGGWTVFYWSWWIAWAPFVGTFIARISRGRTIRQFVAGVLLAPTLASFIWFAIFGMSALNLGLADGSVAVQNLATSIFIVTSHYPLHGLMSIIILVLLGTFFLTSADSATFVLGMFSSEGDLNPETKRKVMWAVIQSLLALTLMIAGGSAGLQMLQTASIVSAFPFAFIMLMCMISIVKVLRTEDLSHVGRLSKPKAV